MGILEGLSRLCPKCGVEQAINEFYKRGYWCKSCISVANKKKYLKNKDKIIEYQKKYYLKNIDKAREYNNIWNKKYYLKNKDKISEYYKNRYLTNYISPLKEQRDNLNDAYIMKIIKDTLEARFETNIKMNSLYIPNVYIEIKRAIIRYTRLINLRRKENEIM